MSKGGKQLIRPDPPTTWQDVHRNPNCHPRAPTQIHSLSRADHVKDRQARNQNRREKGGDFYKPQQSFVPISTSAISLSLSKIFSLHKLLHLSLSSLIYPFHISIFSSLKLHFHLISLPQVCQSLSLTHCTPLIYQHSNSPFLHLHSLLFSQIMKFWGFVLLGFVIFGSAVLPSSRLVGNGTKGEK